MIEKDQLLFSSARPVQFGDLRFIWQAPNNDEGPVKFRGSVAYDGKYLVIDANINGSRIENNGEIPFAAFPVRDTVYSVSVHLMLLMLLMFSNIVRL